MQSGIWYMAPVSWFIWSLRSSGTLLGGLVWIALSAAKEQGLWFAVLRPAAPVMLHRRAQGVPVRETDIRYR